MLEKHIQYSGNHAVIKREEWEGFPSLLIFYVPGNTTERTIMVHFLPQLLTDYKIVSATGKTSLCGAYG